MPPKYSCTAFCPKPCGLCEDKLMTWKTEEILLFGEDLCELLLDSHNEMN